MGVVFSDAEVVDLDPIFVGRNESLQVLEGTLSSDTRLVTLVGAPGLGKSRLARRFAAARSSDEGPTRWIEVEAPLDQDALVARVATAVGAQPAERGAPGVEVLVESLGVQGAVLLILDGVEAALEAARPLLETILARCPRVRVLATSQAALGMLGEQRLELEPLEPSQAKALFRARAQQSGHDFEVSRKDLLLLERLLERLDHMPLAIELAAGHLSTLSLAELYDRLEPDATPLPSLPRPGPPRHRTMREAVAWSWALLSPELRGALTELSIFRGPFSVASAEAVLSPQASGPSALGVISTLRDRSLLRRVASDGRLQLLGEVRRFARAQPGAHDEGLRTRHARWFAGRLERTTDVMYGMPSEVGLEMLELEQDDLRAALDYASHHEPDTAMRCALVLARYHSVRGPGWQALDALERGWAAAERGPDAEELRARIDMGHAILARAWFGRLEPNRLARAIEGLEGRHPALEAEARAHHAYVLIEAGRREEGERETREAVAVAEADGHPVSVTLCRGLVGLSRFAEGEVEAAEREFERALASGGAETSARLRARYLACRGQARIELGKLDPAEEDLVEALRLQDEECRDRLYAPITVLHLAQAALVRGHGDEAERRAQDAAQRIRRVGASRVAADPNYILGWVHLERGDFDDARRFFGLGAESPRPSGRGASALGLTAAALAAGDVQRALEESENPAPALGEEGLGLRPILLALRIHALKELGEDASAVIARARSSLRRGGSRRARAVVDFVLGHDFDPGPPWPEIRLLRKTSAYGAASPSWKYDLRTDLLLAPDGRRFEARSRAKLARLLRVLARERERNPGRGLSKEAIIEAVWPGDRGKSGALENRLWVALSTFRKLGFADLIERVESGYRFRIDQSFALEGEDEGKHEADEP